MRLGSCTLGPATFLIGSTVGLVMGLSLTIAEVSAQASLSVDERAPLDEDIPTFYADVLPILQANCQSCHTSSNSPNQDGGRASGLHLADRSVPMALEEYSVVRTWAPIIAEVVRKRRMPPFDAHIQHKGTFRNERYLHKEEIATLVKWAERGAPAGDPSDAPPPRIEERRTAGEWWIGEPDLIVEFPEPFCMEHDVVDMYVDLHIPIPEEDLSEPRFIYRSQIAPGSPVIHHLNNPYLGSMTPGRAPQEWQEGFSILLEPGTVLELDTHYHNFAAGNGKRVCDQTTGAFVFHEEGTVINHLIQWDPSVRGHRERVIPAGEENFTATGTRHFQEDTYLLATSPHMHVRGKAAKVELEYPDGRMETLLWIPNWDFRWQHRYDFKEPVFMPAGSTLHLTGWWDNSAGNPNNPDPTRDVEWGLASHEEMLTGLWFFANAEPLNYVVGDPIPEDFPRGTYSRDRETEHGMIRHLQMLASDGKIVQVDPAEYQAASGQSQEAGR